MGINISLDMYSACLSILAVAAMVIAAVVIMCGMRQPPVPSPQPPPTVWRSSPQPPPTVWRSSPQPPPTSMLPLNVMLPLHNFRQYVARGGFGPDLNRSFY